MSVTSFRAPAADAVLDAITAEMSPDAAVLDVGGGTGGIAVELAARGADVTVIDPSPDALAALARRAAERGVRVAAQQGDATALDGFDAGAFDVVLCHHVLPVVDEPSAALAAMRRVLRPGGLVSIVVANRAGAVLSLVAAGRYEQARALVSGGDSRFWDLAQVRALLVAANLAEVAAHGLHIFGWALPPDSDRLPDPAAARALRALEQECGPREPYLGVAADLHVLAHRER